MPPWTPRTRPTPGIRKRDTWSAAASFARQHGCAGVEEPRRRAPIRPGSGGDGRRAGCDLDATPATVLDVSAGLPWARWFPGAGLNHSTQALDLVAAGGRAGSPALLWQGEDGRSASLTYGAALAETQRVANALLALGLCRGDRVGVFMPLTLECALAILACTRIGAIFTPHLLRLRRGAVAARLTDSGARLLITADGFFRRGRLVEMKEVADAAVAGAPSVERVLVVRRARRPWRVSPGRRAATCGGRRWSRRRRPPARPSTPTPASPT